VFKRKSLGYSGIMNEAFAKGLATLAQETRLRVFRLLLQLGAEGAATNEIARRLGTQPNSMLSRLAVLACMPLLDTALPLAVCSGPTCS